MKKKIEGVFLNALGNSGKLKWYLEENINLINYLKSTNTGLMAIVNLSFAFVPKSTKREFLSDFNTDRILGLLKRQRPDLYKVLISHHNGRLWLGEQILNFKKYFLK